MIDGTDGSGKATQTKLLIEHMTREGLPVKTISFPRYGQPSAAMVEAYLSGAFGRADEVGPKASSIFYAVDRFAASSAIRTWLENGVNVIADRYVGSNMGHQGSKISDPNERKAFYAWERELEHDIFGIPRPDVNIILHVPYEISLTLMAGRAADGAEKHNLKTDIHQSDVNHLKAAEQTYLELAELYPEFTLVECTKAGSLLSPEEIHERVREIASKIVTP